MPEVELQVRNHEGGRESLVYRCSCCSHVHSELGHPVLHVLIEARCSPSLEHKTQTTCIPISARNLHRLNAATTITTCGPLSRAEVAPIAQHGIPQYGLRPNSSYNPIWTIFTVCTPQYHTSASVGEVGVCTRWDKTH